MTNTRVSRRGIDTEKLPAGTDPDGHLRHSDDPIIQAAVASASGSRRKPYRPIKYHSPQGKPAYDPDTRAL